MYLNNLPFDVDEAKILKSVGLTKGDFRSKGGYGFLEIKDNFDNWMCLNRMKPWKAEAKKNENKIDGKKVFWCQGRPCSLEVEKGRGRWRSMQEFDLVSKELVIKEDE